MVRCGRCAHVFDARTTADVEEPDTEPAPDAAGHEPRDEPIFAVEPPPSAEEPQEARGIPEEPGGFEATWNAAPRPQRTPRRRLWLAGTIVLALVLIAQVATQFRGELALLFPDARPFIDQTCALVGCEVPLPRRADLVGIETSDLQADPSNPSVMVLTATLRNRATYAQAHPSLELTLTNSDDKPLARRVLAPRDYLGQGARLKAGFPGNSELQVKVFLEASALKATGYRLYLFYP